MQIKIERGKSSTEMDGEEGRNLLVPVDDAEVILLPSLQDARASITHS